jgi:hypothetical protein
MAKQPVNVRPTQVRTTLLPARLPPYLITARTGGGGVVETFAIAAESGDQITTEAGFQLRAEQN